MIQTKILNNNALVSPGTGDGLSLMLQGMGEAGTAPASKLTYNGFAHFINDLWKPSFTNIALEQANTWITPDQLDAVITEILRLYPNINPKKINLTGLSAGAKACFIYVLDKPEYCEKINSIVVMSMPIVEQVYLSKLDSIKNLPQWHLIGNQDFGALNPVHADFYHPELARINYMRKNDWPSVRYTEWNGGHSGWDTFYNPTWKDTDGVGLVDWIERQMNPLDAALNVRCYPTVAQSWVYVFVKLGYAGLINLQLKNAGGQIVYSTSKQGGSGETQFSLNFAAFASGEYTIEANGKSMTINKP